ncbi:cytochrome P450 [Thermoflavimicrobium daqui]|uniref:Cytochrome P450 n=1 Tax=Thermoflavimicrobium daqui TaxID=2137476 RepID=A0A364K7U3_9BACL|nr:cytochrome P450 [Thermoflavimicrobium daqui]RAL26357.1 cytochrome P450 [Thermoflavimicrobium daqui]
MSKTHHTNTNNTPPLPIIPGPKAIFGWRINMLKFYRHPFRYSRWLYQTYGNLVGLEQGNPSNVFAFGPELNYQILTNSDLFEVSPSTVAKVPRDTALGRMFFNNLSLMTGKKHKQHRRLIQPAFHRQQIIQYLQDMVYLTEQLVNEWKDQTRIDLNIEMKKLTQRIAVKTLFGLYNETELERAGAFIQGLTKSLPLVIAAPIDLPGTPYRRTVRYAEQLEMYVRSLIKQKRAQPNAQDVLASLIQAHDEDGTKLSDEELIGHTFSLFVAGHETTANALTWIIFLLSQHPNIHQKLLAELNDKLHGNPPTVEQLSQLSLLEGVVKESLRLLPPASIGIRIATAPCTLGGYQLPKGSNIYYSQFVTHRLPELYDEPNCFKPERWATIKRSPYEYLPFSAGQHMCIGWSFAIQEIKVVLAILLQKYRFSVVPHTKIQPNLMMRPVYGMPMNISPQDGQVSQAPIRGTIHELIDIPISSSL